MESTVNDIHDEMKLWSDYPPTVRENQRNRLITLANRAKSIPHGFIKKIVWDEAGGYPEHAWGFVQYTVRPYHPGYGCDGTTDLNIHLIAEILAERAGLNYSQVYRSAYPDQPQHHREWLIAIRSNSKLKTETLIPRTQRLNDWILALGDLYEINNRSLVQELSDCLNLRFPALQSWWKHYSTLRVRQ